MKTKLFGMGAAGNKASILAVQNNVIKQEDVILINSTFAATGVPVQMPVSHTNVSAVVRHIYTHSRQAEARHPPYPYTLYQRSGCH